MKFQTSPLAQMLVSWWWARRLRLNFGRRVWPVVVCGWGVLILIGVGGCQHVGKAGVERSIDARFHVRTLRADLPMELAVPTVAAAAEAALKGRGYAITEKSVTQDDARIVGKASGQGVLGYTVIETSIRPSSTYVMIRVEPWGDEPGSRAILDDMLARLGL